MDNPGFGGGADGLFPGPCSVEVYERQQRAGSISVSPILRTLFAHDSSGTLIGVENDTDADGVIDSRTAWTYDDKGNRLSEEYDYGPDGVVDSCFAWTYTEDGKLLREETDIGADGAVNRSTTWKYDENGKLSTKEYDRNGDNVADERTIYGYDANGRLISEETDSDVDGVADARATGVYDERGRLTTVEHDTDADGSPDWVRSYGINGGYAVDTEIAPEPDDDGGFRDDDGGFDDCEATGDLAACWNGERLTERFVTYDDDCRVTFIGRMVVTFDPIEEAYWYFTYDDSGNLLSVETEHSSRWGERKSVYYTYDCWSQPGTDVRMAPVSDRPPERGPVYCLQHGSPLFLLNPTFGL